MSANRTPFCIYNYNIKRRNIERYFQLLLSYFLKYLNINLQEIEVKGKIFKKRRIFKIFVEMISLDKDAFC